MTTHALPRRASLLSTPQDVALSDLQDAIRALPLVEFKEFDFTLGQLSTHPVAVETVVRRPMCVTLGGIWLASAPSTSLSPTGFHWSRAGNGRLVVDFLGGLTIGLLYTMSLKIEGARWVG